MTNEEARLVLDNARPETTEYDRGFYDDEDLNTAINMAMEALKDRPTATLDEIKAEIDREYEELDGFDPSSLGTFAEKVDDILDKYKAEVRPKGEWLETFYDYECSNCHIIRAKGRTGLYNFCPSCGADMKKGEPWKRN